ncbi:MAG: hypothetical protein ACRD0U_20835, partial [Acidimicrobiales bacterium]
MKGDENDDEFVVQVEIVGHAGNAPNFWEAELAWIGAQVLAPIWRAGVQFEFAIPAQGYHGADEGITPYIATAQSPIRFSSEAALRSFSGVIGHQHAPAPDCVAPETPILCADLIWRAAGDLVVGDELVAVEESPSDRWGRTLLTAVVERNWIGQKECARVITDRAEIVASVDHPWL